MQKATRQQTKHTNTTLVLKTIYQHQTISRAHLARLTGLTRTTISEIMDDLLADGLVREEGMGESQGGKPPIQVGLAAEARGLACLDVSKDLLTGAITDLRGRILARGELALQGRTGEAALQRVYQLLDQLIPAARNPLLGIGVGAPGRIDSSQGVIRQSVHRGWSDLPLRDLIEARYGCHTYIANDSHIAALGEYTFGGRRLPNLILIDVGEGIGAGMVLGGQIYSGDGFSAGEIGHISVDISGEVCACGNRGCLETYASTRAILNKARQAVGPLSLVELRRSFECGNPAVAALFGTAAASLGASIANVIGLMNIQHIVLAGEIIGLGEAFLGLVRAEAQKRVLPAMAAAAQVSLSSLGDDIVLLGAAALVLAKELELP
jgi:predicted NBD/HSP70 family sugar kinase